jgi:PleD family two-component response regulator
VALISADDAFAEVVAELLPKNRYQLAVRRQPEALANCLADRTADAVLIDLKLPVSTRIELGRQVRGSSKPTIPVIGVCPEDTSQDLRLTALSDGLWDVIEVPGASAELVAKLETWVWVKRDVDGLQSCTLLDAETGHYSAQGIKRRLRELTCLTQRIGTPLACVVFGADQSPDGEQLTVEAVAEAARKFSLALHHQTRNSDVVGRLESLKFLVLAPNTPPWGAVRLAERFTSLSLSRRVDGEIPVTFSAGVAGVEGKNGQVQASPDLLLNAASRALNQARSAGVAQVSAAWAEV